MLNKIKQAFREYASCFTYLAILTGFLLIKEISFFIMVNKEYFGDFSFISEKIALPWTMVWQVLYFLLAQLLLHLAFIFILGLLVIAFAATYRLSQEQTVRFSIFVWLVAFLTVLALNKLYYPNSKSAWIISFFVGEWVVYSVLTISAFIASAYILALNVAWFKHSPKGFLASILSLGVLCFGMWMMRHHSPPMYFNVATSDKPNIIIIGVDSLRPDFLGYNSYPGKTKFMDEFLDKSSVFSEALTPLARTFPSWMSILTGKHPKQTGIRSNLVNLENFDFSITIGNQLRKFGYETLFATDETRFSNIDTSYGFDKALTPPIGVSDFLLGTLNDFPLSNVIINTALGQYLFPHSYANRPVYFTYNPDSFLNMLKPAVLKNRSKPLFMAVHFCLTHHPYEWSGLNIRNKTAETVYESSVARVDQQLEEFYTMLKEAHLLDHAMVILLSDHGEALSLNGDRVTEEKSFDTEKQSKFPIFYSASLKHESINQSAGHGTDVLSLVQYHTVLAVQLYGLGKQFVGSIPGMVSLTDIKPTILNLVSKKSESNSLLQYIQDAKQKPSMKRHIFIESDFSPQAIRTVYPEAREVMLAGIEIFKINPKTLRLTVRDDMLIKIIKSKQYADIYDHWMLALYPQPLTGLMPILVNLDNGIWTNNLNSSFAKHSPAKKMLDAIKSFYAEDISAIS